METKFQERILLSLDDSKESEIIKKVLRSPLELSQKIIYCLFKNEFDEIVEHLDSIKQFVAGIERGVELGSDYRLAKYYPNLFSFHQFFHSSYRARQGKTLEELLKEIIRNISSDFIVADTLKEKNILMRKVFLNYDSKLDLDVVAAKNDNVLVIQLRSRDDTGGTTAKGSLSEALKKMMTYSINENSKLFYVVGIWDIIDSNQKQITKDKIFSNLENSIEIDKDDFKNTIENGIQINETIKFIMSYGFEVIGESIKSWVGDKYDFNIDSINNKINMIKRWDDLWLSYTICSLELENIKLYELDNITYLNEILKSVDYSTDNINKYSDYVLLANKISLQIISEWKRDIQFLNSVSEKVQYIRDLILLRFIYDKIS